MARPTHAPAPITKPAKKQPGALGAYSGRTTVKPKPVAKVFQQRAATRLAKLRGSNPKSLPGINPVNGKFTKSQRVAISNAIKDLHNHKAPVKPAATKPYDPLQPLTGKDFTNQVNADEKMQFGDADTQIANQYGTQGRNEALTASAYDQYKQALADATDRINKASAANVAASQAQVDNAYTQDKAAADARDKAATADAAAQGLTVGPSQSGAQVVESQRTQGNNAVAADRTQNEATNDLMEKRTATSVLQKAEAQGKQADKRAQLDAQAKALADQHGAFKISDAGKLRDSERTYALARKEFDLKVDSTNADIAAKKAQTAADAQKAASQVIVARIYAAADKDKAKAQVRVAQLQLKKGKIDQHQYRTILNIYKGLPKKGKAPAAKSAPATQGQGSGPNGAWAPWEKTKIDTAVSQIEDHKFGPGDKAKVVAQLVRKGYSQALAQASWDQYIKKNQLDNSTPYNNRPRG